MHFKQFYLGCLAHASYLIGSEGEAAVGDPRRDVDDYLAEAQAHGLRIRYVIETDLHADFVSGHRELAERTGAEVVFGKRAGAAFPHRPVGDGDELRLGAVVLMLYDSRHGKLLKLPDDVLVYPAHGAGSLCGRNISSDTWSTIGDQRRSNHALQPMPRDAFIKMMTADLPELPPYFAMDVENNRGGAPPRASHSAPPALSPEAVQAAAWDRAGLPLRVRPQITVDELAARGPENAGQQVVDVRRKGEYAAGHVPGARHVPLDRLEREAALLDATRPTAAICAGGYRSSAATSLLENHGFADLVNVVGGTSAWIAAGHEVEREGADGCAVASPSSSSRS